MDVDIILENEKLVYSIINKYKGYHDMEDLYQEGMKALVNAYNHYDKDKGSLFSTYAYTYILGEVTKYIRENNNVRLSKDVVKLKKSIERAKEYMYQHLFREPTIVELSLFLEIDEEKIKEVENIHQLSKSLDYMVSEDSINLYDKIKLEDKSVSAEILDLKDELKKLTKEEKEIIYNRYYMDMTQTETSKALGISQPQIYRKENKIYKKLRENL